jgi:hypothetical protein
VKPSSANPAEPKKLRTADRQSSSLIEASISPEEAADGPQSELPPPGEGSETGSAVFGNEDVC